MVNSSCRTCDRSADADAYCRWCAASIIASASAPTSHGDQDPRSATHPVNSAWSGSPGTGVTYVTIMRKIAACWTCGRTLWVWRLRERNFCSGKRREQHRHARGYRGSRTSRSGGEIDSRIG